MTNAHPSKRRHFQADIILQCVRWYLSYPLSYPSIIRDAAGAGSEVDYTAILEMVQRP